MASKNQKVQYTKVDTADSEREIGAKFLDIWAVNEYHPYNDHREDALAKLEAGDEVWLKLETQGYSHVLLYIGNAEVVHVSNVQKTGLRLGKTIICRDKLDDVAKDHLIGIRKTEGLTDNARQIIVERGLGDVGKYFPYLLTTDNCEHQVKYWISGVKDYRWMVSTQVRDHIVIAFISGAIGGAIGAGLVVGFWSTDVMPILIGVFGCGLTTAVLVAGFKYCITSLEYRRQFRGE